jgi:hypothetical protein
MKEERQVVSDCDSWTSDRQERMPSTKKPQTSLPTNCRFE